MRIRQFVRTFLLGFAALFVTGGILQLVLPAWAVPNLSVLLLVSIAVSDVSPFGVMLAFMLGLQFDVFAGILVGPWAGAYVAVYAVLSSLAQRIFLQSIFSLFLVVFLAVLGASFSHALIAYVHQPIGSEVFMRTVLESIVTALVAPPFFSLAKRRRLSERALGYMGAA